MKDLNAISMADQDEAEAITQYLMLTSAEKKRLSECVMTGDFALSALTPNESIVAKWLMRAMIMRIAAK